MRGIGGACNHLYKDPSNKCRPGSEHDALQSLPLPPRAGAHNPFGRPATLLVLINQCPFDASDPTEVMQSAASSKLDEPVSPSAGG